MSEETPQARVPWRVWWGLGVLTTIGVFAQMDRVALSILMQPIKLELHLNDQEMGLLSGLAFTLFYATLGLPLARHADRASRTRLLAACLGLWTIMTALSGLARSFPQLFLARVGVGVGEAGSAPASHSLIGEWFPRHRRALAVSIFQCGAAIGISAGTFVVGVMAHQLGWRLCLQLIGVAGIPLSLLALLTVPEPPRSRQDALAQEPLRRAVGALIRRPALVYLAFAASLSSLTSYGQGQWMAAFMMRSFGLNLAQVGAWAGLSALIGTVLGTLAGGVLAVWLTRRDARWELWIPAIAMALATPFTVGMVLAPWLWLSLTCKIFVGVLMSLGAGVALAAVQSFVEPNRRATAIALVLFLQSMLGLGLGPYLVGLVSDLLTPTFGQESLRYGMAAVCLAMVGSVALYILSARISARDRLN